MPQRVAVVGAGIVGLSTAWFLQEHGVDVTVHERRHVAAGSSWGNAGWLNPSMTAPMPEPSVLRYGVRAMLSPSSPVYVPLRPDPHLLRFLTGFARHSTARRWATGMRAYAPVNRAAVAAFDELTSGDVDASTYAADPFLACFRTPEENAGLLEELEDIRASGQDVGYDVLTGSEARDAEPSLSTAIGSAVLLHDQRYVNPPVFLAALADAVRRRGGRIVEGATVTDVQDVPSGVVVTTAEQGGEQFDQVVLAHGAWLGGLARRFGVRQPVQSGRGYSFSVAGDQVPRAPLYFPRQRVACTPLSTPEGTRLRVAGTMELRDPDAAADPRRIEAIVEAVRPLLRGVDLDDRGEEWVGARPCTGDGLPLVGPTRSPRVFVAGGHAMSGIFLGPVTGKLLAQGLVTGHTPAELVPFDPLR
ncbi:NAD(P)/FAD-dependent oxidoreductase [Nocardioides sp. Soil805]|uniref:NAD(P)/FAD-dependent oxidoreductase n=1 Tax=Nocardioides sp. Soil805 TaxID=1736416 RepID=UPI00070268A8|nr:FAD-dependent oxidoreductase [Nocardioides sp. Soil805]KRF36125.1 amino acid dehydrogenase [Nocardioides sp. Soil805]